MSIVKSFSVGNGDMFYIKHNSDSFTTIDCCIPSIEDKTRIFSEIEEKSNDKSIKRFISTHPDNDHITGLTEYNENFKIENFYCVKNNATKKDSNKDFDTYCRLRDGEHHYYLDENLQRKWINVGDEQHQSSKINCLWPIITNNNYKEALEIAKNGGSPNNISPIITYSIDNKATFMWMGDMESDFQQKIKDSINWPKVDILFAPHHGRDSGKIPEEILNKINPKIIIIGEAPSKDLNYYNKYNTITQNSAGDITFLSENNQIHIYVSSKTYSVNFLTHKSLMNTKDGYYIGTLMI